MSKLIGTAPNQAPTNGDLGSMAYEDSNNFQNGKGVILDKLLMHFNAHDPRSWPHRSGSTATWYNIAPGIDGLHANMTSVSHSTTGNESVYFDGGSSIGNVPYDPRMQLDAFTLEVWFRPTSGGTNGYHSIFQKQTGYSGAPIYGIRMDNSLCMDIDVTSTGPKSAGTVVSSYENRNYWTHIMVTCDPDDEYNLSLYVNSEWISSAKAYAPHAVTTGAFELGYGDGRRCVGNMGEVRVYTRCFSDAEVKNNYNASKHNYV